MIAAVLQPIIRRTILDLLFDIGGEQNDMVLARLLMSMGHRVARRDVVEQLHWLAEAGLVAVDRLDPFITARILQDGRDLVEGAHRVDGVSRFRTSD